MIDTVKTETHHEEEQRSRVHTRIRRTKKFLRPLPRRANLHRWPILKWFANAARKTPHLWKFGEREVRTAIYLGSLIAFLPIFGAQFVVAFFVALSIRTNLLVIMAVQLVTNPATFIPIYAFTIKVGNWVVELCGLPSLHENISNAAYKAVIGGIVVGLVFAFILDLIFRFFIFKRLTKSVNVKRMLKS